MLQAEQVLKERYQLHQQLGRTAAGRQTWLAKDLQSNERVTLKLLAFSPQMQWEELKLFEREAQVLQALNHPRIPLDLPQKDSRIQFSDKVSLNPSFLGWIEQMTEIAIEKRSSTARQALDALQSGRMFPSPKVRIPATRKLPKPDGTYIKLKKTEERLKITIPAPGLRKLTQFSLLGIGFFLLFSSALLTFAGFLIAEALSSASLIILFVIGLILTISAQVIKITG